MASARSCKVYRTIYILFTQVLGFSRFCWCQSTRIRIELRQEGGMISLRLVRLIELHSDELTAELVAKLEHSSQTSDLHKVPVEELRRRLQEILQHFSEWLLTKTGHEIEQRYFEMASGAPPKGLRFPISAGQSP